MKRGEREGMYVCELPHIQLDLFRASVLFLFINLFLVFALLLMETA